MRTVVMSLALASLASGLLFAERSVAADASDPVWAQAPDRADWAKAYPVHAAQAGISGAVQMRCSANTAGALQNCTVISEAPTNEGFGAAALSLASGMELKSTTADGKPVGGRSFIVPVKFDPDVLRGGTTLTRPDWLRKPTDAELVQYIPANGSERGGHATVHCYVTNRGLMDRCSVVNEAPLGLGYGGAALELSELFVMRPMTVDGQPVGGAEINIPIRWEGGSAGPGLTVRVVASVPWIAAPNTTEVAAAYPKAAIGKIASAHVIMRCAIRQDGGLQDCERLSELPAGEGFGSAADSLIKDFRVPVSPKSNNFGDLRVDVPFDFRDPGHAAPPVEIRDPVWIQQIKPDSITKLFPEAAIKAGFKVGRASVDCTVAADGTLTGCATATEDPAGYGFGDAALIVANVMRMSPWTKQGAPAEGARINLPIKFVLPDNAPAAAPAPAAPPAKP